MGRGTVHHLLIASTAVRRRDPPDGCTKTGLLAVHPNTTSRCMYRFHPGRRSRHNKVAVPQHKLQKHRSFLPQGGFIRCGTTYLRPSRQECCTRGCVTRGSRCDRMIFRLPAIRTEHQPCMPRGNSARCGAIHLRSSRHTSAVGIGHQFRGSAGRTDGFALLF